MAGSDQWGNIINGIELSRRSNGDTLYGLTAPLLTTAGGAKMGKTAGGAVWLNEDKLSNFDFWQYWRNVADADVGRFLRIFTDLPLDEISKLEVLQGQEVNEAKKILADEVTKLIRGMSVLDDIHHKAKELFDSQRAGGDLSSLPSVEIPTDSLPMLIDEFAIAHTLTPSKGEIRRLIQGLGVRINDQIIEDIKYIITPNDFANDNCMKLSIGKKKHFIFRIAP